MANSEAQTDLIPELMQGKFDQRKSTSSFSSSYRKSVLAKHLRSSRLSCLGPKLQAESVSRSSLFANIVPATAVGENFKEVPEVELSDAPFEEAPMDDGRLENGSDLSKEVGVKADLEHPRSFFGLNSAISKRERTENMRCRTRPAPAEIENTEEEAALPFRKEGARRNPSLSPNDSAVLLASDSDGGSSMKDLDSEMNVDAPPNKQEEEYLRMSLLSFQILHKDNEQIMALDPAALHKELRRQQIPFYKWTEWLADLVMRLQLESAYKHQAARQVQRRSIIIDKKRKSVKRLPQVV